MKVAACVIVRNEATDIASWLAWYHVIGFDTCIVFDDDSTDGTWDIVKAAASIQDIRLMKSLGDRDVIHDIRQIASYCYAIKTFKEEFDWIAFFDCDEFLYLTEDRTIQTFLRRFPQGGAVSINWCNYGSSGFALKPLKLPVEAFTWHLSPMHPVNRHVKTILHLGSWTGQFINMHCFDVPPGLAVDPSGKPMLWDAIPGISVVPPDWSIAKVMHYQCRSMEHFIERLKRLPGLIGTLPRETDLWDAYNHNDVEDRAPLAMAPEVNAQRARYPAPSRGPRADGEQRPDLVCDIGVGDGQDSAFYLAKGFRVIGVEANPDACISLRSRFESEINERRYQLLNFAATHSFGETANVFAHRGSPAISGLARRHDVPDEYSVHRVPTIDWPTLVAQQGVPRYLKIDIEGSESAFLGSIAATQQRPEFLSVACRSLGTIEMLARLGYTRFLLIDQNPAGGFRLPSVQAEGKAIGWDRFTNASGPFGLDLFQSGQWLDLIGVATAWTNAVPALQSTWFDCHAWKP